MNISLRGGDFEAEVLKDGSGPPLLYLHGAIGQKGWAPFLDTLAKSFTVYAPYMPGYSKSTSLEKLDDVAARTRSLVPSPGEEIEEIMVNEPPNLSILSLIFRSPIPPD